MLEINKIYCMDCLDGLRLIDNNSIGITITSPPYNANCRYQNGRFHKIEDSDDSRRKYVGFDDAMQPIEYYEWQRQVIKELMRVTRNQVFYNIQILNSNKLAIFKLFGEFSENIKELIIWDKKYGEPAIQYGVLNSCFELIIVFDKSDAIRRSFSNGLFGRGTFDNIIRIGKNFGNIHSYNHSAIFPKELVRKIIKNFSVEHEIILDPFMGSGVTAVVAKELCRNFIGFEINNFYCGIINKELSQSVLSDIFCKK